MVFYYFIAWASIIFSTISFKISMCHLKKESGKNELSATALSYREWAIRLCFSYLVASILIIIPGSINRIYMMFHDRGSFFLSFIQTIGSPGKGLFHLAAFHYTFTWTKNNHSRTVNSASNQQATESTIIPWPSDSGEFSIKHEKVNSAMV
ncbi:hypothetical protein BC833DRAFT_565314 [Globomyces pollinis-pini]|nr:hypothetical protein BC833DRAFT_565314 [Globomyces pollinis-pini]